MSSALNRGGTVVKADVSVVAVLCKDWPIRAVGPSLEAPVGATAIDAGGAVVMPGGIDPHAHMVLPASAAWTHAATDKIVGT